MSVLETFFPESSTLSEQELAAQSAAHVAAISLLVEEHSSTLYRVAYSVVRNAHDAEDVVQEVYLRVLKHRAQLAEIREPRVWLVRIAWNLSLDRRRRRTNVSLEDDASASARQVKANDLTADEVVMSSQGYAHILKLIDTLPAKEKQVLLLSALEDLSTVEIALVLETTESTVRSRLFRARQHLKKRLEEKERDRR